MESQPHRDRTRTTRNYFIGLRYLREKKKVGEHEGNQHGKNGMGKKVPDSNTTALRIAAEEGCSDRHIKTCEKMSLHIDDVCRAGSGMEWVRDLILTERVKYGKVMLDELVFRGAGGCRQLGNCEGFAQLANRLGFSQLVGRGRCRAVGQFWENCPTGLPPDVVVRRSWLPANWLTMEKLTSWTPEGVRGVHPP